jgi:hypothetical protein
MSIGQFGTMGGLIAAYHLNANANDFSGSAYHGTDTDITYDPVTGILGPGAKFDGDSSKIVLPAGLWTPMANATFSIAVVVQLPASAPGTQPIFGRCNVSLSGPVHYGCSFVLSANSFAYVRNDGNDHAYTVSANFAFESSKRYLIGLTYDHITTGNAVIYCIPLFPGKVKGMGSATLSKVNVAITAPYDQGLNIGANLRNASNQYSSLTFNEFLVFNKILPLKWYVDYAAFIRGFK